MASRDFNIWDYLAVLVKWRKFIVLNFVVVCVIATGFSFLLPKWYRAKATLLPPIEKTSGLFGVTAALPELQLGELALPGIKSPADIFKAILESRTVAEGVINKLGLMEIFGTKNLDDAILRLWDQTRIEITNEGLIGISVEERNSILAARIANCLIEELDRVNQNTSVTQAKSTRIFVEARLEETLRDLKESEEALRIFQENNKTVSLPEQTTALIQSAAELKARQVSIEVEKGVLLKALSRTHPQVVLLQSEIDELQKQLNQITLGNELVDQTEEMDQMSTRGDFEIPLSEVPTVGLQLARLTRDVKIQEAIFELLTQQYEQAKIQEAKDTPTVQVLDHATPPSRKVKPKRALIGITAGISATLIVMLALLLYTRFEMVREEDPEKYKKILSLFTVVKGDLKGLLKKK